MIRVIRVKAISNPLMIREIRVIRVGEIYRICLGDTQRRHAAARVKHADGSAPKSFFATRHTRLLWIINDLDQFHPDHTRIK
jgi:hypothetical protein